MRLLLLGLMCVTGKIISFSSGDATVSWSGNEDARILLGQGTSTALISNSPTTTFPDGDYSDNHVKATGYAFTAPEHINITSVETSIDVKAGDNSISKLTYHVALAKSNSTNNAIVNSNPYQSRAVDDFTFENITKGNFRTYSGIKRFTDYTAMAGDRIVCYIHPATYGDHPGQITGNRFTVSVSYVAM